MPAASHHRRDAALFAALEQVIGPGIPGAGVWGSGADSQAAACLALVGSLTAHRLARERANTHKDSMCCFGGEKRALRS